MDNFEGKWKCVSNLQKNCKKKSSFNKLSLTKNYIENFTPSNFITKYFNILLLKKNYISTITGSPQMERQGTTKVLCSLVCNISSNQWMVTSLHQHFRLQTANIELRNTLQYFNTNSLTLTISLHSIHAPDTFQTSLQYKLWKKIQFKRSPPYWKMVKIYHFDKYFLGIHMIHIMLSSVWLLYWWPNYDENVQCSILCGDHIDILLGQSSQA